MLDILKSKQTSFNHKLSINNYILKKNTKTQSKSEKGEYINTIYYPFSSKEWFTNIYSYNKSYVKSLITNDTVLNKLLQSYCNMLQDKIKILFKRRRYNKTRYSANKLYTSRAELNHTNTKIFITLYLYNKQKSFIEQYIRKIITWTILKKKIVEEKTIFVLNHKNRLLHLLKNSFFISKKWNTVFLKKMNNILIYLLVNIREELLILYKIPTYYIWLLKKFFNLQNTLFTCTKLINFNKNKFNNVNLYLRNFGLISLIEKLYNKKVEIDLVELKSIHLNSDVFSSAVALKLRDRKNKAVRILRKAILQMVRIPDLHTLITFDDNMEAINKNNIIKTIKQQIVSGVRFEASGRLTRRLTAMRAVFKYRYAGSLKNIRSSFNNKSSTMLRGYVKSNSQYSLINSKTRNGTFGLKGWVSSHNVMLFRITDKTIFLLHNECSNYIIKPHQFASMPLQSSIFTINRNFIIGLVSSIITAAMGYVVRLILFNYLEYDIFTNLDNWIVSLSYFCSLGSIRFVINEYLKENTFQMYSCGGTMPVSNTTVGSGSLPVGIHPAGYISPMQAPNDPGIGSSRPGGSSGALITDSRSILEQKIIKVEGKLNYFREQVEGAEADLDEIISKRFVYIERGKQEQWQLEHNQALSALKDCNTNLSSELRMHNILKTKLANGDYSMSGASATTKRSFTDSSISKDDSSRPTNKRTSDNP